MIEQRKDVKGYEGLYGVSNKGKVVSYAKGKITPRKLLINPSGYYSVMLYKDGKKKLHRLHRMIGDAFIPNPYNKPCINHKNLNKLDNSIDNLERCTFGENIKHAYDNKAIHIRVGQETPRCKLQPQDVLDIRSGMYKGRTHKKIADHYKISERHAGEIINGTTWKHLL